MHISFTVTQTMSSSPTPFPGDLHMRDNICSHKSTAQEDYREISRLVSQCFQDGLSYFYNK